MAFAGVEEIAAPVRARDRRALPLLLLRRCDADPVSVDVRRHRDRRRRARRRAPHRARRGAHAGLHARRHEGDREDAAPGRGARPRRADPARQHLPPALPPGRRADRDLGGLHRFMGWDAPILTDSGGFQVFSLRDTIARVDDDGVTFNNVYDGSPARFTPELAAADPGEPRQRHRDVPRPGAAAGRAAAHARGRGAADDRVGAAPARTRRAPTGSSASGSRRAASTPSCAAARPRRSPTLDFDGNAIGGLAIGEDRDADVRDDRLGGGSCCRRTSRATSWASATRRGSSR